MLLLKLVLVPSLIAAVSLATRRWGPRIGGWLAGMPLVAGPTLFFIAVEQGDAFAAGAAGATLVALVGVAGFALVYARLCRRAPWPAALLAAWLAFAVATLVLNAATWPPLLALGAALASLAGTRWLLPADQGAPASAPSPAWDLPLRMAAAVALVLTVTSLAAALGPRLSGALTPFPIALSILVVFLHAQGGPAIAVSFLRAFLPAMWSFVLFCFVLAVALVPLGRDLAFASALALQLLVHGLVWWRSSAPGRGSR
jgi:hypothetical protein